MSGVSTAFVERKGSVSGVRAALVASATVVTFAFAPAVFAAPSPAPTPTGTPSATCEFAAAAVSAGQTEAASAAYLEVLKRDPASACALDGLRGLRAQPTNPCAVADRLAGAGAKDSAIEVLKDAVKKGDTACAPAKLEALTGKDWWDRTAELLKVIGAVLGVVVIPLALAYLFLVYCPIRRVRDRVRRRVRAMRSPQVTVGPFPDSASGQKLADVFPVLVSKQLATSPDRDDLSLRIVDKFQEIETVLKQLEDLTAAAKPVTAVTRLIDAAVPAPRWNLSGPLRVFDPAAAAVTAQIKDGPVLRATETFSGLVTKGDPKPHDFEPLAVPLAAWLVHTVAADRRKRSDPCTPSTTATSYAWLCAGVDAHERDQLEVAELYYQRAVQADPNHFLAWIALWLVQAEIDPIHAVDILQSAVADTEAVFT